MRIGDVEYTLIYEFKLAELFERRAQRPWWKTMLLTVALLAFGLGLGYLFGELFGRSLVSASPFTLVLVLAFTFTVHEGIHGFFFWIFGGKPTFGMKVIGGWKNFLWGFVLYATADAFYTRNQYYLIGLSPFVVISLISLMLLFDEPSRIYAVLAGSANAIGAAGDIYMTAKLRRFSSSILVRDTADGYEIYDRGNR